MISKTALTYGGALYDLAQEEHLEDAILDRKSTRLNSSHT
mgnify:CR=1 FL=1